MLISVLLMSFQDAQAKVKLPSVFSDNMVFQQKTKAAVWGKADPGKTITISTTWSRARYTSKADGLGNWKIMVATPSYGGPYAMTISDGDPLILMNVLIGEVWICSGQSNMEMPLAGWGKINNYEQEVAAAKYPSIRLLQVDHVTSNVPSSDAQVANLGWKPCIPQYVADFSSVAYFFAKEIYEKKGIPIGLIHTSWGGTPAEAWMSSEALSQFPYFNQQLEALKNSSPESDAQQMVAWQKTIDDKDKGYVQGKTQWAVKDYDDSSWATMPIGTGWENSVLPDFDGVVWLRKKVEIPASFTNKDLKISLGTIDDNDITYFNGEQIGETIGYDRQRMYTIPAHLVKKGFAEITIRVFDGMGGGGVVAKNEELYLATADGTRIALTGDWKYKVGINLKEVAPAPISSSGSGRPTVLYNNMIHPFLQFAVRGVIWYQGESNADRATQYRELFPALINDWRKKWNLGDLPFYFVQLANFKKADTIPGPSAWAELRDAQFGVLKLKNTGMAVAIDIGDANDIHPKNKQEVGHRLALIALAKTYGVATAYSGPLYRSYQIIGDKIRIEFDLADGLKIASGKSLLGFTIAGADQKFYSAQAIIVDNHIEVISENVKQPIAVRYGWEDNPSLNLTNKSNLPASPFRTDNWPGITK
ncbi:9-O-acetylesterase [Pedobacter frigiditerrae]|uniref:9-O-acetylesterase n=2 Tax=Pedobacter frigiditerrae TaxID=2530452 RepID=A0A4V2MHX3_9SPHI|nr:9-O-acetylesterase [Pedobacter frigiditerrae]